MDTNPEVEPVGDYYHGVFGACPWYHSWEDNCDCDTPRCRSYTDDRAAHWRSGAIRGPGRVVHRTLPLRNVPQRLRRKYRQMRELPEDELAGVSRMIGGFNRASSVGPDLRLEISKNLPRSEERQEEYRALTFGLGSMPCTEEIPWRVDRERWRKPCPNDRRGPKVSKKKIKMCQNDPRKCYSIRYGYVPRARDFNNVNNELDRVYVCEDHRKDSLIYFRAEKLLLAHLVGTCRVHRLSWMKMYPEGINTCTCRNVLDRWLCRACYGYEVKILQNHFRRRVVQVIDLENPERHPREQGDPAGNADRDMLRNKYYHTDWKGVRRMLAERHPCSHHCGRQRWLKNEDVMDCRSCGGIIVKAHRQTRSETRQRLRRDFSPELVELGRNGTENQVKLRPNRDGSPSSIPSDHSSDWPSDSSRDDWSDNSKMWDPEMWKNTESPRYRSEESLQSYSEPGSDTFSPAGLDFE